MTTTEATPIDLRQQKGRVIASTMKIVAVRGGWRVPSQSFLGTYVVRAVADGHTCSCPDFEERQRPCKHVHAVQFTLFQQTVEKPDGSTVTTTQATARVTYSQDWPAYNRAQTTEKDTFLRLLHELCGGIEEPAQTKGRPRLPLRDMLFASAYKVYSTVSARRFMTDLRDAQARGFIARTPHYNSIFNYLENEAVTPVIMDLITRSSLPLKAVETDFAVDSTGFGTSTYFHYYRAKYGQPEDWHDWVKVHAMVGVKTNIVTSVEVTHRDAGDAPLFKPLVEETARNFQIREVSADKAYLSHGNIDVVDRVGGTPYIPFKVNSRGDAENHALWRKLFHFFSLNRDEFLAHYHKRSNVESTFSVVKRVFGGSVRSKTFMAQVNEALLKVLCHNIRCLVHAIHELGITPEFERLACTKTPAAAQEVVPA